MIQKIHQSTYSGKVHIPASKSDGQRALLIASLGKEQSTIANLGSSKDELAMLSTCKRFAEIEQVDKLLKVQNKGMLPANISIGESGLGLRLLTSVSSLQDTPIQLNGEGSLLTRNQSFFTTYFPKMGVEVTSNDDCLPISIRGPLQAGFYEVDGSLSSQYISGLLIAFSQVEGVTELTVLNEASSPYIAMTIQTLRRFGIHVLKENNTYKIYGKQSIQPTLYRVEGDWSSASYWLVASALGLKIQVEGLSMQSLQADKALLNALTHAHCKIQIAEEGITIDGTKRTALDFDATNCPDLFPALAVYAACTEGTSRIRGVHRLVNKESNRALAIQEEWKKLGIEVEIKNDEMIISGVKSLIETTVDSHNDHRIAMSLAVLAMVNQLAIEINGADAVQKSYPHFWDDVNKLKL